MPDFCTMGAIMTWIRDVCDPRQWGQTEKVHIAPSRWGRAAGQPCVGRTPDRREERTGRAPVVQDILGAPTRGTRPFQILVVTPSTIFR